MSFKQLTSAIAVQLSISLTKSNLLKNLKKFKNQINLKINTWKIGYLVKNVAQNL